MPTLWRLLMVSGLIRAQVSRLSLPRSLRMFLTPVWLLWGCRVRGLGAVPVGLWVPALSRLLPVVAVVVRSRLVAVSRPQLLPAVAAIRLRLHLAVAVVGSPTRLRLLPLKPIGTITSNRSAR